MLIKFNIGVFVAKESLYISKLTVSFLKGNLVSNDYPYYWLSLHTKTKGVLNLLARIWEPLMIGFSDQMASVVERRGSVFLDCARDVLQSGVDDILMDLKESIKLKDFGFKKGTAWSKARQEVYELADKYITHIFEVKFNDQRLPSVRSSSKVKIVTPEYLSGYYLERFQKFCYDHGKYPLRLLADNIALLLKEKQGVVCLTRTEVLDFLAQNIDNETARFEAISDAARVFRIAVSTDVISISKSGQPRYWNSFINNLRDADSFNYYIEALSLIARPDKALVSMVEDELLAITNKVSSVNSFSWAGVIDFATHKVSDPRHYEVQNLVLRYVGQCYVNALQGDDLSRLKGSHAVFDVSAYRMKGWTGRGDIGIAS
jgi:hypothetical protein